MDPPVNEWKAFVGQRLAATAPGNGGRATLQTHDLGSRCADVLSRHQARCGMNAAGSCELSFSKLPGVVRFLISLLAVGQSGMAFSMPEQSGVCK
jgi:hypothetical protein